MFDFRAMIIGVVFASLFFLIKERKNIFKVLSAIIYNGPNTRLSKELRRIMDEENISLDEAKQKLLTNEIIKALDIDMPCWEVNKNLTLIQGNKVSFVDKEVGFIQGDFLGLIKPDIVGYDYLYVIRNAKTSIIRKASISYVEEDTINVY